MIPEMTPLEQNLLALLQRIQWNGHYEEGRCPACLALQPHHAPECELLACLKVATRDPLDIR